MSLCVQAEDLPALNQDELHDLVLVHHVDCHVAGILLRPHEGGAKDNAETLSWHQVLGGERQNPEVEPQTKEGGGSVVDHSGLEILETKWVWVYLSRWLKRTFIVSWLGRGSCWTSFFTPSTFWWSPLISVKRMIILTVVKCLHSALYFNYESSSYLNVAV